MLLGILLGISISLFIVSGIFLFFELTIGFQRTAFTTGAAIGSEGIVSYSIIIFVLSLIAILFIALIIRKPKKYEYMPTKFNY